MRKIKINKIGLPVVKSHYIKNNMYSVHLGNGSRTFFSNLKDAKKFIADTNRFLNLKCHELNYLYINIRGEYQKNWFYFDNEFEQQERNILEYFKGIDNAFIMCIERSHHTNGNYFVFKNLFYIIEGLQSALNLIIRMLRGRKHHIDIKRLQILNSQAVNIKQELIDYAKTNVDIKNFDDIEFIE